MDSAAGKPQPSPALKLRIEQLQDASIAVRNATRRCISQAHQEGFRFPALLEYLLKQMDETHDDLKFLLRPETLANSEAGRDSNASGPTEAATKN